LEELIEESCKFADSHLKRKLKSQRGLRHVRYHWLKNGRWITALLFCGIICWNASLSENFSSWTWANDQTPYEQGVQAYQNGDYKVALDYFHHAERQNPKDMSIRYYMAVALEKLSRYNEAILQYQYVAEHGDNSQAVKSAVQRLAALQEKRTQAATPEVSPEVSIVPLKKSGQALMVDAKLNNQVSGTFILDTGATYTSISREMAEEMGLDLVNCPKVRITTANGRIEVPKVMISTLNVNGLEAHDVEATVIDVRKGSSFSGLLGLSFIRKFKLTIDPESNSLIFQQI
jgi:clan AA aspartic protease (TIGR02281 family)